MVDRLTLLVQTAKSDFFCTKGVQTHDTSVLGFRGADGYLRFRNDQDVAFSEQLFDTSMYLGVEFILDLAERSQEISLAKFADEMAGNSSCTRTRSHEIDHPGGQLFAPDVFESIKGHPVVFAKQHAKGL